MGRRLMAISMGAVLLWGCSREVSLAFTEGEDGTWTVPEEQLDRWARALSRADEPTAARMLDEAYTRADSLSKGEELPRTLEIFSSEVAERFLSVLSPLYNEKVYEMALDREQACESWQSWGRRSSEWRRGILNLNRPGYRVSDFWLSNKGMTPDTLLRRLLPGAPQTVLFIYGEACPSCDKLLREITGSRKLRRLAESGRVQCLSLYTGEDLSQYDAKAAALPSYWDNWYDREHVVKYDNAFDNRRIPSLYLIGNDEIVILRGARTVKELLSAL